MFSHMNEQSLLIVNLNTEHMEREKPPSSVARPKLALRNVEDFSVQR